MGQGHISINGARLKNIIYLAAIIGGYAVFFHISSITFDRGVTTCPFKNITGIPCPGCGMGRATLELLNLEIKESLLYHPLAIPFNVAVVISIFWLLRDIFKGSNSFLKFVKTRPNKWIMLAVCLVLIAVWVRNIMMGL